MNKLITTIMAFGLLLTSFEVPAEEVTLNFSDADLGAVINSVSQITGKNFIIDPRVKGRINVVSAKPLNEEEVYNVFLSILQVHGFSTVPTENAIKIIPDAAGKQNSTPFASANSSPDDQLVTRVLKIQHVNAPQLVPILRPLVAQQGHMAAYPTSNMMVISDRASNVKRIARIIGELDKKIDSGIEIIKLEHAFAAEVVRLLSALNVISAEQKKTGRGGIKIAADERTNSVLLSGERLARLKYRAIIYDLDSPVESVGNTHVVYLRYANAKNIATILNTVGQEALKAKSAGSGPGSGATETVNVQADEESNALVISAPVSVFHSLRAVIQQLDIPRAQVHIEAIIAEVSFETSRELGVQWLLHDDGTAAGASTFKLSDEPSLGDIVGGIGGELADAIVPTGGILGLGSVNDDGLSVAVFVRALQGDADTNLLSTPSLVTLDNQEAEIIVGEEVPFLTGYSTSSSSSTENPFQTIERQDIGIQLKVTPQINEGDAITMEINQEVSDIKTSSEEAVDLITTKRSISTTVQLEDGELLILGGLITDRLIESDQKVPILGDLPLIGALFRATNVRSGKQNLMVFIRATIIKDPAKARRLSVSKYNFLRDLQLKSAGENQPAPALVPYENLGDSLYEFETAPPPEK